MSAYQAIFAKISPIFRRRRMRACAELLGLGPDDRILDIGGTPWNWLMLGDTRLDITLLNIRAQAIDPDIASRFPRLRSIEGDALALPFSAGDFTVVFSNSVIEHLHSWENQTTFAREALRVAGPRGALWIQTPARGFFIEPHWLTIGLHWLPRSWQRRLVRWASLRGLLLRPTPSQIQAFIDELRLLSASEMRLLFTGFPLRTERFLGLWPKSYVAYRPPRATPETAPPPPQPHAPSETL